MQFDFNISPILPACGNAARRSNVEAGLWNERGKKRGKRKIKIEKKRKYVKEPPGSSHRF